MPRAKQSRDKGPATNRDAERNWMGLWHLLTKGLRSDVDGVCFCVICDSEEDGNARDYFTEDVLFFPATLIVINFSKGIL